RRAPPCGARIEVYFLRLAVFLAALPAAFFAGAFLAALPALRFSASLAISTSRSVVRSSRARQASWKALRLPNAVQEKRTVRSRPFSRQEATYDSRGSPAALVPSRARRTPTTP